MYLKKPIAALVNLEPSVSDIRMPSVAILSYYADASGENISHKMITKIDSEKGRNIYPRRIAIVEPVFGNIRTQKRLDKFNLRGKIKVNIQWLLYCMVHNIEKVANYGFA